MDDRAVRDRLSALAGEVPPQTVVPDGLVRRARRRGALVVGSAVVAAAVVAVSLAGGVRALLSAEPKPAVPPIPAPIETDDAITVMLGRDRGAITTGAAVFDPDGDPAARRVLRIGKPAFPLDWSSDGRRLLFMTPVGGPTDVGAMGVSDGRLYILEPNGGIVELDGSTGGLFGASWSPDGSQVVFAQAERNGTSLFLIDPDSRQQRLLLAHAGSGERLLYPSWSPDGRWIAFVKLPGGLKPDQRGCPGECPRGQDGGARLALLDPSSGDWQLLGTSPDVVASAYNAPAWSPDGRRLAFAAYPDGGPSTQLFVGEPFELGPTGSGPLRLTSLRRGALAPTWSPDGERLAFVSGGPNRYELWLVDADGSDPRSLLFLVPPLYGATPVLWDRIPV